MPDEVVVERATADQSAPHLDHVSIRALCSGVCATHRCLLLDQFKLPDCGCNLQDAVQDCHVVREDVE